MAINTLSRRIDKAAEQWRTLQAGVDAKAASALKDAGASLTVPPEQWPADCLRRIAFAGWTVEHVQAILERAEDNDSVIRIQWLDGETWNGRGEAPMLVVAPGLLDKLEPDENAPDELLPVTATPETPKEDYTGYVYRRERETRRPFPHELAERRRRPRWTVR